MNRGIVFLALVLVAFSPVAVGSATGDGFLNSDHLVEPEWLIENLDTEGLVVIDFGRAVEEYESGHIPGASRGEMGMITTRVGCVELMVRHPQRLAAVLEGLGISDHSTIVVYDDARGLWASRFCWTAEYLGLRDVRLLDGGWQGWVAAGGDVSVDPPSYGRGSFTPQVRYEILATMDWINGVIGDDRVVLLDVRASDEFSGENVRAERGGHIPGAVHLDWVNLLTDDGEDRVLSAAALRELLQERGVTPDREIVAYCQAGIRASHTYLVLRLLGYPRVRVYDGSWLEWGNDPDTPIE